MVRNGRSKLVMAALVAAFFGTMALPIAASAAEPQVLYTTLSAKNAGHRAALVAKWSVILPGLR